MMSTEAPHKHLAARVPSMEREPSHITLETKPLLLYILTISLCAFPLGWDLGTTGNLMDLPTFRARLGVSAQVTGVLISVFNLGCICACIVLFMTKATRKFGHLIMFRICLLVFLIGSSLLFCGLVEGPSSIYLYSVGRAIQGASAGALCVIGPIYISHLCTFSLQSNFFLAVFQIVIGVFVFLGNCLFIYTGPHSEIVFCIISVILPIFGLVLLVKLPESPRESWILCDPKKFRNTLDKLLEGLEKEETWVNALHILRSYEIGEATIHQKQKLHTGRFAACCILLFLQQMTGANFFFYFGKTMFDLIIIMKSSLKFSGLLLSLCNLGGTIISGYMVRRSGARKPLFSGLIMLSLLLFIFASMGIISRTLSSSKLGIPMLVTSCLFLFAFAMTWGPCTAVISVEISQADERILSGSVICGWVTNVLVVSLFPILVEKLGLGAMYIFLFFTVVLIWFTRKDFFTKEELAG